MSHKPGHGSDSAGFGTSNNVSVFALGSSTFPMLFLTWIRLTSSPREAAGVNAQRTRSNSNQDSRLEGQTLSGSDLQDALIGCPLTAYTPRRREFALL